MSRWKRPDTGIQELPIEVEELQFSDGKTLSEAVLPALMERNRRMEIVGAGIHDGLYEEFVDEINSSIAKSCGLPRELLLRRIDTDTEPTP